MKYDKILEDEQWDGFYAIETSERELSAGEIAGAYHDLWKIEETFRTLKTHFQVRPMYHWTPQRIKGHLVVNYIALIFERKLEIELRKTMPEEASHGKIREAIETMELALLKERKTRIKINFQMNKVASELVKVLKLKPPQ